MKFADSFNLICKGVEGEAGFKKIDFKKDRTEKECLILFSNLLEHIIRGD